MFADDRLTRLRSLIARLESLPASAESDWMLREARGRMVDVETGERPEGMRPLPVDPPADAPRRRDAAVKRPTEPRSDGPERRDEPAERPKSIVAERADDLSAAAFGTDGLLWLEDSTSGDNPAAAGDESDLTSQRWRRGLRG
jgi:hypothetical protein